MTTKVDRGRLLGARSSVDAGTTDVGKSSDVATNQPNAIGE